jgi:hypothetical protein
MTSIGRRFVKRLVTAITDAMTAVDGNRTVVTLPVIDRGSPSSAHRGMYELMREMIKPDPYAALLPYLAQNDLEHVSLHGLVNPTYAVCSVYETQTWPGTIREDDELSALPLVIPDTSPNPDALRKAIHAIWRQSNWNQLKDTAAFDVANLGDQLFKVVGDIDRNRTYFQLIPPDYLTELDTDGRGYLTYVRVDIPQTRRLPNGRVETYWDTEAWDKYGDYRHWEHDHSPETDIDQLGTPLEQYDMEQMLGTAFVPFVLWRYRISSASPRGVPAIYPALGKIIYADALTTALHERLTNHNLPDYYLTSAGLRDMDGMSVPPPQVSGLNSASSVQLRGGVTIDALPSGWDIRSSVAQLDYAGHLNAVNAHFDRMATYDLPELAWYTVSEAGGDLSGKALNYKLTPAKGKIEKGRGTAEAALIQITQQCLTVAQNLNLAGFAASEIGTYDDGSFDFWIQDRPIVPLSAEEQSDLDTAKATRVQTYTGAGMALPLALEHEGADAEEAQRLSQTDIVSDVTQ